MVPETSASRRQQARHRRRGADLADAGLPRAAAVRGPPAGLARLDVRHAGRRACACRVPSCGSSDRLSRARRHSVARPGLLAIPSFRRGVLVGTLFFFTTAFYVLFAIYEQEGYGTDPLHTGLAILPYGIGLFVGPLGDRAARPVAPLAADHRHGNPGRWLRRRRRGDRDGPRRLAGRGRPCCSPALARASPTPGCSTPRSGDVAPHQAGVAAGVLTSALQIGAAISVAGIGSLFFAVLGHGDRAGRLCPRVRHRPGGDQYRAADRAAAVDPARAAHMTRV